jgi:hypothetical protein
MDHANEITYLIEEMTDNVSNENKDALVPKLLKEAITVWKDYNTSKLKLNLTEKDYQLHLKMMKRLWDLADNFNATEKVAFPFPD